MQSCEMPALALESLLAQEQRDALAKIHHEHLGNGRVRVRQYYSGTRDRDIHEAMDADREVLERAGATNFRRTRIGRNATCPCGSGRKFKKCCMAGARVINTR